MTEATITEIELMPSRHGGFVYSINFDTGKRCYVDPDNKNYTRWQEIVELKQLVKLRGLKTKAPKHKRLYDADSRFSVVLEPDQCAQYDELFTVNDNSNSQIEWIRCDAIDWAELQWLIGEIKKDKSLKLKATNVPDINLMQTELHLKDERSVYIIPIHLGS